MKWDASVTLLCREVSDEAQMVRVCLSIYREVSPALARSAGALLSQLQKPRVELITGWNSLQIAFQCLFLFLTPSLPMGASPGTLVRLKQLKEGKNHCCRICKVPQEFPDDLQKASCFLNSRDPTPLPSPSPTFSLLLLSYLGFTGIKLLFLWQLGCFGGDCIYFYYFKADNRWKDTDSKAFKAGGGGVPFWCLQGESPSQVLLPGHQLPVSAAA